MQAVITQTPGDTDDRDVVFAVTGMTCGSCAARIEQVLVGQDGVDAAVVDLASNQARVRLTPAASVERITRAVAAAGYTMSAL